MNPVLDEEHVVVMLYNILCSLNYIHSTGLIHRDLKPSNILVDCNSQIQICDFGLSRTLPKSTEFDNQIKQIKKDPMIASYNAKERDIFKKSMRKVLKDKKADRQVQKREMSPCVQTRWYRAPEIILTEKTYDQSVDIWSAGLVLGELMKSTDKYQQKCEEKKYRNVLFKGKSCFPISPADGSDKCSVMDNDQIFKVLERYPEIEMKKDFSFLCQNETVEYVQ